MSPDLQSPNPAPLTPRCASLTKGGKPCRNWALPDSHERYGRPLCRVHLPSPGASATVLASHRQLYGAYFTPADVDALDAFLEIASNGQSLAPEIETGRVLLRHILEQMRATPSLANPELARLTTLALDALRTIARLVRDQYAITPEGQDQLMEAIGLALDDISAEWGIKL
jgi:hypothetical protein